MNDIERDLRRRLKKSIRKRIELNNRVLEYQKEKQELIEYLKDLIGNRFTNGKVVWFDPEIAKMYGFTQSYISVLKKKYGIKTRKYTKGDK